MKSPAHTNATIGDHKLYKRRWFMLFLFVVYIFNGLQQWTQFTIIGNLVSRYYNVTTTQVEWTANVFTLSFIILAIPSLYLMDSLGIRYTMIIGAVGVTLGTWIKVFSVAPDRFNVAFSGQCCSMSSVMLTYGLIGRFTATWFGADEITTSGVIIIMGDQLGSAFGYFFPTVLVKDSSEEMIGNGLWKMHLCVATTSTIIFFLILIFFEEKPKLPPSIAQVKQKQVEKNKILPTLMKLMKNPSFLLFVVSYGLNFSVFVGVGTCFNELVLNNFPGAVSDAGNIGTLMMISGMICSLLVGRILDKTRLFKESAILLTSGSTVSMIIFTWSLQSGNLLYVHFAGCLIGFFLMGYFSSGIQLGIELTYPIHEEISTAFTVLFCSVFSLIVTIVYGYTIKVYGDLKSNMGMIGLNIFTVLATLCIPNVLKRQQAENESITREAS